jgi:hypothetical protein
MIIYLAIISEVVLSLFATSYNDWAVYGLIAELRVLFWMYAAFILSTKLNLLIRSCFLFFCFCQMWTCTIFGFHALGIEFNYILPIEIVAFLSCFLWLSLRPYSLPKGAVPLHKINPSQTYVVFKKVSKLHVIDIVKGFMGYPVKTAFIICDGNLYGYVKKQPIYTKIKYNGFGGAIKDKYAIKIPVDITTVENVLNRLIGSRFKFFGHNCSNTPKQLWYLLGMKNFALYCFPGVLAWNLSRGLKNAK